MTWQENLPIEIEIMVDMMEHLFTKLEIKQEKGLDVKSLHNTLESMQNDLNSLGWSYNYDTQTARKLNKIEV